MLKKIFIFGEKVSKVPCVVVEQVFLRYFVVARECVLVVSFVFHFSYIPVFCVYFFSYFSWFVPVNVLVYFCGVCDVHFLVI